MKDVKRSNTYHKTHPILSSSTVLWERRACAVWLSASQLLFEWTFSTYCMFCKLMLRILPTLHTLQIILGYCVYSVFYKLTSAHITYIVYIALHLLHNIVLHCIAYFTTSHLDVIIDLLPNRGTATWNLFVKPRVVAKKFVWLLSWKMSRLKKARSGVGMGGGCSLPLGGLWGSPPGNF